MDKDKTVQIIEFDQNMVDISKFAPRDKSGKELRPKERPIADLINPPPGDSVAEQNYGLLRYELHERLATPLYPIAFVFLAIALMGQARTTRENRWGQILTVFGLAVALRVAGITAGNLVTLNASAVILVYAIPLGAILIAAWTAHVRMSPELRSKRNFELKFRPKNIKLWAGRGVQTG